MTPALGGGGVKLIDDDDDWPWEEAPVRAGAAVVPAGGAGGSRPPGTAGTPGWEWGSSPSGLPAHPDPSPGPSAAPPGRPAARPRGSRTPGEAEGTRHPQNWKEKESHVCKRRHYKLRYTSLLNRRNIRYTEMHHCFVCFVNTRNVTICVIWMLALLVRC